LRKPPAAYTRRRPSIGPVNRCSTCVRVCVNVCVCVCAYINMHSYIHTNLLTYIHIYRHTYIKSYKHIDISYDAMRQLDNLIFTRKSLRKE
jgi:hypothetical protein